MAKKLVISEDVIVNKIFLIRGQKVMLDSDLADVYGVETKIFNQSVKRNAKRFPPDFMFQLTEVEYENLRSQIVTSSWGGRRYLPKVFTEQGVAMLSGILSSERAIEVNIFIIRIFAKLREMLISHKDVLLKLDQIEKKITGHDEDIQVIFSALKQLMQEPNPPRQRIGFKTESKEKTN